MSQIQRTEEVKEKNAKFITKRTVRRVKWIPVKDV